jgi:hypothetical protein
MHEAMRQAVAENPHNAPTYPSHVVLPGVMPDMPRIFLAAITGKLWRPGRTLRVAFLDGDSRVQQRIVRHAQTWSQFANLHFEFTNDPQAELRISFLQPGSWSYIGTDALVIPVSQPTMNFGWLTQASPEEEYARVVNHEFGHAIGCIHEHQNPAADIPWDHEAVYAFYQGAPNYWTREQVDINLFTRYSGDMTQFSEFDPHSIMLYPIPNEFTIGDFEVGWNSSLSSSDKHFASILYPFAAPLTSTLQVNGLPIEAEIGSHGEVDTYTFQITEVGLYRIATQGQIDVVMSLFGPNDDTRFISEDDDSGDGFNAALQLRLRPGLYTVRVRHYSKYRTGLYSIALNSV